MHTWTQLFSFKNLVYVYEYFACIYVCGPHACLVIAEVKEGLKSPETGDTDSFELFCWCWGPNLGPLEEKPMLLTTESILQP